MAENKKKLESSSLSENSLNEVSGGAGKVELDHTSGDVKWYKVTNEKTGKTIKTNYEKRANELANNPNDPSWRM